MSIRALFDLTGQRALVTGASRGIGLQIAESLADLGCQLLVNARPQDEAELNAAAQWLQTRHGVEVDVWVHDLLNIGGPQGIAASLAADNKPIGILVNNAGSSWAQPAETHELQAWQRLMDLNLTATFVLAQEVARRWMIPNRRGKILNIASVAGLRANPMPLAMHTVAYNASKGGLLNATRALAAEWGKHGINVNAICPGFFPTRLTHGTLERAQAEILALTPLNRLGTEEDLQGLAALLCSDAGRHISGQCIAVDGGLSAA